MADEIDLEAGDPTAADDTPRETRRRRRRTQSAEPETPSDGLRGKLREAFDKLAEQLEVREDEELATAIREESDAMAAGIDSMTRVAVFLRMPVLIVVAFAMPVLAFWRVGGILFRRFMARRQRRWEEAQAAAEAEADPQYGGGVPVGVG